MNNRIKKRNRLRNTILFLLTSFLILFSGLKSAFSSTNLEEDTSLDPSLSLSFFEENFLAKDDLSIQNLKALKFSENFSENIEEKDPEEEINIEKPEKAEPQIQVKNESNLTSYTIKKGDSIEKIARRFRLKTSTILSLNNWSRKLSPGKTMRIPSCDGIQVKISKGMTAWDIAKKYKIRLSKIAEFNQYEDMETIRAGATLFIPGAQPSANPITARSTKNKYGFFYFPVNGRISSSYGYRRHPISGKIMFHRGLDIAAPLGTSIHSVLSGVVSFSGRRGGYGNLVEIRHSNGIVTRYGHTLRNLVKTGARVKAGTVIAKVGSTGYSTGPHLHFEVIVSSKRKDPAKYLARR